MNNIELGGRLTTERMVVNGKKLTVEWLDKAVLIYSEKDYPRGSPILNKLKAQGERITKLERQVK